MHKVVKSKKKHGKREGKKRAKRDFGEMGESDKVNINEGQSGLQGMQKKKKA